MAEKKYKPLSFSTTMRNPERMADFLKVLIPYENKKLTNDVIHEVVKALIKQKLYSPQYISKQPDLKSIKQDENSSFSDSQVEEIILNSPQDHGEPGFDHGWPSRFDTWYKLSKEFGFVYYKMNSPIIISRTGHMLVDAISDDTIDYQKIQTIFLNALAKYQTDNPFRRTLINNLPLPLLLNVIDLLKQKDPDSPGIYKPEISFFICWPNNDAEALCKKILGFRKRYKVGSYSDEIIYNECLSFLGYGEEGKNYVKQSKVTGEAVDEYIRKMRITGVVSLRGNGRCLDWNQLEKKRIEHIIAHYSSCKTYSSEEDYYEYMGEIDQALIETTVDEKYDLEAIRLDALRKYANEYSKEYVNEELRKVCKRNESKDELLKYIPGPVRLEFLTSIALLQNYDNLDVRPNYPVDDEGLPTSTASGGMADIECKDDKDELVEVSLMCGRNQVHDEMIPITRHLTEAKKDNDNDTFALFIAPTIHPDAMRYSEWINYNDKLEIYPLSIERFIAVMGYSMSLSKVPNHLEKAEYAFQ